jgi:DNA N-6-adenine-methyltransferase (Dam)
VNKLFEMDEIPQETKSAEWYTPAYLIEAARSVMGGIELDPASCEAANQLVKAERYYTKQENGLLRSWSAETIWLNPPYGRTVKQQGLRKSTIGLFIEKLLQEYQSGNIGQAIVLATTEVNAKWFYPLFQFPICFPDHRVHFIVPEKLDKYSQMFGTALAYLGPNEDSFIEVFSRFGHVVKTLCYRPQETLQPTLWSLEDAV